MRYAQLEHLLRAAGAASGQKTFVVVGSAAIFLWRETVPASMMVSREADLFAYGVSDADAERIADELEELGQASIFDQTFGYYVDGVVPSTVVLPPDWKDRSKTYSSRAMEGVTAIVPHPEDIALAKLCAGREKDVDWATTAYQEKYIDLDAMESRIDSLPGRTDDERARLRELLQVVRHRSSAKLQP